MSILQAIFNVTLTRLFAVFGFTLCLGACSSMDELIPNDKLIIEGQGEAVIVLEAGAGDGPSAWLPIRPLLAKEATVVSYWRDQPWQTSPITGQDVAAKFKQGRFKAFPNTGHYIHHEHPQMVSAEILKLRFSNETENSL